MLQRLRALLADIVATRRRWPSSTWDRTASASRSAASRATRSSASTPGARRSASARASTRRAASRWPRASAALACLARFRERLSGLHPSAVRAVGDQHVSRRAAMPPTFLPQAEAALGFPIDIIGGHEEARLIYLGVAHVLPPSDEPRLVDRHRRRLDRVHHRPRHDAGAARVAQARLRQHVAALLSRAASCAPTHSRPRKRTRARKSRRSPANSGPSIGSEAYRIVGHRAGARRDSRGERPVRGRHHARGPRPAAQADGRRRPHLAPAARRRSSRSARRCWPAASRSWPRRWRSFAFRGINPVGGALRLGVLYDLLGRTVRRDSRAVTVETLLRALSHRPRARHARRRDGEGAVSRSRRRTRIPKRAARRMGGAAARDRLHACRTSASTSTARTSSRTPTCRASRRRNSASSRCWCSAAAAGCRRWPSSLDERRPRRANPVAAARRAVPSRAAADRHAAHRARGRASDIRFRIAKRWLKAHPLTAHLLDVERAEWKSIGENFSCKRWRPSERAPPAVRFTESRGSGTTFSTTAAPPSFARLDSHHTAPLRTDQ